jgi:hypothetical protein
MGSYVMKVSGKAKKLLNADVFLASFAYKPYARDAENMRLYQRYAAPAERVWNRKTKEERQNVLIVHKVANRPVEAGDEVYLMEKCYGAFMDGFFDRKPTGIIRSNGKKLFVEMIS